METDPKQRLAQIKSRLGELKQERTTLLEERERLRESLGKGRRDSDEDDTEE
jgi:hypothetical protein